ncbi:MAG: hypothetical protein J5910_08265 [Lachnospiraceae bacterium]|nr:hypothetical protein [Lachnospiraceae bacterium]
MKKKIMISAIVLLIVALVCYGLSAWFYYQGGLVMDGPGEFYQKMGQRARVCENLAKGFGITGAVLLVISFFVKKCRGNRRL